MPQNVQYPSNATEVALGNILKIAGIPTAADGAGFAPKGMLCIDYTNADLYINQGTQAVPSWVLVGPPAA